MINFIHNLGQYNLVRLIVMYAFMQNCAFQNCLHMHLKSFDAGITNYSIVMPAIDMPAFQYGFVQMQKEIVR